MKMSYQNSFRKLGKCNETPPGVVDYTEVIYDTLRRICTKFPWRFIDNLCMKLMSRHLMILLQYMHTSASH